MAKVLRNVTNLPGRSICTIALHHSDTLNLSRYLQSSVLDVAHEEIAQNLSDFELDMISNLLLSNTPREEQPM